MSIFEFDDYRDYLVEHFESLPKKGYGKLASLAKYTGMNPATITLVLRKDRDFTLDQANLVGEYLGFSELEYEYFFMSVQVQRAGTKSLRARLSKKLLEIKARSAVVKDRLSESIELDDSAKAIFYSDWYFSAVRLVIELPECRDPQEISRRLAIEPQVASRALEFLLQNGLLEKSGENIVRTVKSTHVSNDSPHVVSHHKNWRLKAIEKMRFRPDNALFFTSTATVSREDMVKIRRLLLEAIEKTFAVVDPSEAEELVCLNIDWFSI